ncbi:HNH endonuclease [Gordonia soli]|uniref:HNH nuclease domain-containing protein n=1 Tax=Gordonia soli NBRC 108243 TaxID=1223545 RepID=M0QIH3_9ACTN|nr:HNH endonuclease [Gordonia soli]GAC67237.1 hypothetical protein GS4_06_00830 [Gordonia soli NBRC 108243]
MSTTRRSLVAAVVAAICAVLALGLLPAHANAALKPHKPGSSTSHGGSGGGGGGGVGQSAGKPGPQRHAPTTHSTPGPSHSAPSSSGNSRAGSGSPSHRGQSPKASPQQPHNRPNIDRGPHKFTPKTKAGPNAGTSGRDHSKPQATRPGTSGRGNNSPPTVDRGPHKSTPQTRAHPATPDRHRNDTTPSHRDDRPTANPPATQPSRQPEGKTDPAVDRRHRAPDGAPGARPNRPGSATPYDQPGLDGRDNDGDGIVDNENPFDDLPAIQIPMPRGGGFPGLRPPAPAPAPQQPKVIPRGTPPPPGVNKLPSGRYPPNSRYAGEQLPLPPQLQAKYPEGIRFNEKGFPEFGPYAKETVDLPNGFGRTRPVDERQANEIVRQRLGDPNWKPPSDYTWHHNEDGHTMQLVPTDLHRGVGHAGGVATGGGG